MVIEAADRYKVPYIIKYLIYTVHDNFITTPYYIRHISECYLQALLFTKVIEVGKDFENKPIFIINSFINIKILNDSLKGNQLSLPIDVSIIEKSLDDIISMKKLTSRQRKTWNKNKDLIVDS